MTGLEDFTFKGLWLVARHLPGFLLRIFFTRERLSGLVHVDVLSRHDPVTLSLAPPASATVYLQIINLSPVSVELDRAEFRLVCGGVAIKSAILKKQTFKVGQIGWLLFQETMQDSQAQHIAKATSDMRVSVDGHMEFNCGIQAFSKTIPSLDGIRPRLVNENFWSRPA